MKTKEFQENMIEILSKNLKKWSYDAVHRKTPHFKNLYIIETYIKNMIESLPFKNLDIEIETAPTLIGEHKVQFTFSSVKINFQLVTDVDY